MNLKQSRSESPDHFVDASAIAELLGRVAAEFFEQRAIGKMPSVEEYARRYPEIAEHIARTFPALELVDQTASHGGDLGTPIERPNDRLGDFEIVRELGRGGMGVVYEAEQLSIGRRVALKVLPFAILADPRALARFRNEVRAAATLDHPHIVTVHSVGEERGIHYFAMQLIRGQSLAEVIFNLRQIRDGRKPADDWPEDAEPTRPDSSNLAKRETRTFGKATTSVPFESEVVFYRSVAELGQQAANALHFAHEQGVIHRDVKPANLMLDESGKIYVTDFGLARIESDPGLTMTGDLIGTLRYMAPEQTLAKQMAVDHRADVYGLGATLYELATLKPIFDGVKREQLLRQVASEHPTAPSKIVPDIPRDLETILVKSLSKDPQDRYETAAELAQDLQRWLEHKPILGRRPNALDLAQRWVRRNPALAMGSLIGLVLLAGALLLGMANADAKAEQQRRLAYGPMVNMAFNEYAEGHFAAVDPMLATTKPGSRQTDLRSFEWRLLKALRDSVRIDNQLTFDERIRVVRRSPGGRWLAILTIQGQLSVVDLENNHRQTTLKAAPLRTDWLSFTHGTSLIAFSPDDRYLYSTAHNKVNGEDSPLLRFDLSNQILAATNLSTGTTQPDCYSVSVGPDGQIATLGWAAETKTNDDGIEYREQTCVTRDPDSAELLSEIETRGTSLVFSPDGKTIAVATMFGEGDDETSAVDVLDADHLSMQYSIPCDNFSRIARFSPDSRLLATNSVNGVNVWDVSDSDPEQLFELHTATSKFVWDIKFLDDDLIATTTEGGDVEIWQVGGRHNKIDQLKLNVPARAIEFFEDTQTLAIGGTSGLLFKPLRRTPTGPVKAMYMHVVDTFEDTAALVTDDYDLLLWQPSRNTLDTIANVWDDLPPLKDRPTYRSVTDISFAPDGQTIAIAQQIVPQNGELMSDISIWGRDGSFVREFEGGFQAKFTPDGKHIVTSAGNGILALWDWRTGTRIATAAAVDVPHGMLAMEFSRQGSLLATGHGGHPGKVCVWKVEGEAIQLINEFDRPDMIEDLCFTADEQWVIAGGARGVEQHHVRTRATKPLETGSVRGVELTPDGKRIVTAGDNMIRFWDVETGERMGSFDACGFLTAVRFLGEYQLLYVVHGVGARVLDATPE